MWKLANIIPIPKPNKDTNMGTSYRPISLLSVVAKTLEKCLLPYITANITQTPTQHGYKAQHSTVTALHTLNNTVAKGFNQMAPTARTITVALDMSKAFDTVNTHIAMVRNKLSRINGILHRLKYYFPQNILITLYKSLFTPHINYGSLLWGQAGGNLDKLQKKTIRTITYNNYTAHTEPLLKELNLLKVKDMFDLKI